MLCHVVFVHVLYVLCHALTDLETFRQEIGAGIWGGGGKSVYDVITYCTSRAVCKDGSSNFEAEGLKG